VATLISLASGSQKKINQLLLYCCLTALRVTKAPLQKASKHLFEKTTS